MSKYVPIKTEGGRIILLETDNQQAVGLAGISTYKDKIAKSFKEVSEALKEEARSLLEILSDVSSSLKEVEIEFAIKVDVEAQTPFYALAKASTGGTYTVKLKFKINDTENVQKQ